MIFPATNPDGTSLGGTRIDREAEEGGGLDDGQCRAK